MHCSKCEKQVHKLGMCKDHFYNRKQYYNYLGHKNMLVTDIKDRKCLLCDKIFASTGNRRCDDCNATTFCEFESNVSLFVAV